MLPGSFSFLHVVLTVQLWHKNSNSFFYLSFDVHLPNYYLAKEHVIYCCITRPTYRARVTETVATAIEQLAKSHTIPSMKKHYTFHK